MHMGLTTAREDYLKAILILGRNNKEVRNCTVGTYMNLSKASVSVTMKDLEKAGYIKRDEEGCIHLTKEGTRSAEKVYERYQFLKKFLMKIGVSEKTAKEDACKMEHTISEETLKNLEKMNIVK